MPPSRHHHSLADHQTSAAPGDLRRGERPPTTSVAAPSPGAVARSESTANHMHPLPPQHPARWDFSIRRSARLRPLITPLVWDHEPPGLYPITHPYVRRYWCVIVGPGAVADLLRLATAAQRGAPLALPTHLDPLARADLIRLRRDGLEVKTSVPQVPPEYLPKLPPRLRRELLDAQDAATST